MSGLVNILVIGAVIAVVVVRQCSARQISDDRRWWILPGILLVLSLREPDWWTRITPRCPWRSWARSWWWGS